MITNLIEDHVRESYKALVRRFPEFCGCDLCRDDVLVYALNRVPPKYASSAKGKAVSEVALEKEQQRAAIDVVILEGIRKVQASPRHPPG